MRAGSRIVVDEPARPDVSWCWHDKWSCGVDSAYGILSKFALLNAIGACELVELFIRQDRGVKTQHARNPNVDLRTVGAFDVARLAKEVCVSEETIAGSFVLEKFPNAKAKVAAHLQWCEQCLYQGLHVPFQQLDYVSGCPVHGIPLKRTCPKCSSEVPYRLTREVFRNPFACPACGFDLAPGVKDRVLRDVFVSDVVRDRITEVERLLIEEDRIVSLAYEFDRLSRTQWASRFAVGRADLSSSHANYSGFVSSIMEHLQIPQSPQASLTLERINVAKRGIPVQLVDIRKALQRRRKFVKPERSVDPLQWSARLDRLEVVYRSVRRYLRRHVLGKHARCVDVACKTLWWDTSGAHTACFCDNAMAYIRWRMYWEGISVPIELLGSSRRRPSGLSAWSQSSVSIIRYDWSDEGAHWVMEHAFVLSLFARFRQCMDEAFAARDAGSVVWERKDFSQGAGQHWAVSGNDSRRTPLTFYYEANVGPIRETGAATVDWNIKHFKSHLRELGSIVH